MDVNRKVIIDTNVYMEDLTIVEKLIQEYDIYIPYVILQELDKLKNNYNDSIRSYKARKVIKFIDENYNNFNFIDIQINPDIRNDDLIIDIAKENSCSILTSDICMKVKCRAIGVPLIEVDLDKNKYKGYREIYINNEEDSEKLAEIYKDRNKNLFDLNINEYLLVKDENGRLVDKMRYTKNGHVSFNNKSIDSSTIGKIKPLDEYQSCLIDSLINNDMTMVKGKAGSGKTLFSLAYSFSMIERGKYNKLIVFANPVNSRNSARLGYYPGTRDEKLLDSFLGSMLASKVGGMENIRQLIGTNKLELLPFSDIRGFDTSDTKAIIYIVEAQNLSIDLMKLAIQRVGKECKLIIDGDYNTQVDMAAYEGSQNGMRRVSEIFRGEDFYGEIELQNIYRSKIAHVADFM